MLFRSVLATLPPFCKDYFRAIDATTTAKTRISYAYEDVYKRQGADLVNDIWGFKHDKKVAELTARYKAACCLMHNRHEAVYGVFLQDMITDMEECVKIAKEAGVADDRIILDPGVGFGKTYEMNLEAIHHVDCLHTLGLSLIHIWLRIIAELIL